MERSLIKLYGRPVKYADHPAARLAAGLSAYIICIFAMNRYGYTVLAYLVRKTGIRMKTPYAVSFLELLGVFIAMLIVCVLIKQSHIFVRRRRSVIYGIFLGGYMFLYAAAGIVMTLMDAEGFQGRYTVIFSILYFVLVGITEELVFRGITADLLMHIFKNTNRNTTEKAHIVPAVIVSGMIFALFHAMNLRNAAVSGVLVQMAGAFIMGMFLTAVYYRSGNIYSAMILHVMNDLAAALPVTIVKSGEGVNEVISGYEVTDLLVLIPYLLILVFLIRHKKQNEIKSLWNDEVCSFEYIYDKMEKEL